MQQILALLLIVLPSITLNKVVSEKVNGWPEIEGFDIQENYPVYIPDNLWDYINGAADAYLSYHFQELKIAEYINLSGETIKVEIYKHESHDYAYGIYCSERFPDYNFIDIHAQGYAEPGLVHFLSGLNYVKVVSGSENPNDENLFLVASEISKWLGMDSQLPKTLQLFPVKGKVVMSECFVASNFLGHEFLGDAYIASYEVEDHEFKIFMIQKESPAECVKTIQDYMRFAKMEVSEISNGQYEIEDRYNGEVILMLEGNVVFGFLNCGDEAIIDQYFQLIIEKL